MNIKYYLLLLLTFTTTYNYSMDQLLDLALNEAVRSGNTTLIPYLIKAGAKVNKPYYTANLKIAIQNQDLSTVRCLLENGAPIASYTLILAVIIDTPELMIKDNYYAIIECLLDYGADINVTGFNTGYHTALDYALLFVEPEIGLKAAQLLLNRGANIHRLNSRNETVRDRARDGNRHAAVAFIDKYLELEQEMQHSITQKTITNAVKLGHISSIKTLIEQGYVFNRAHLCTAINKNNIALAKLLLESGTIPTEKQLRLAKTLKHREIGRLLIAYLGLSGPESLISTTGLRETGAQYALPKEITHNIASFLQSN
jgi:ankyrin repeat protein